MWWQWEFWNGNKYWNLGINKVKSSLTSRIWFRFALDTYSDFWEYWRRYGIRRNTLIIDKKIKIIRLRVIAAIFNREYLI